MITIYNVKKNSLKNGIPYLLCELRGLSTDEKPTELEYGKINNGSVFIEMDTQNIYFFDLNSNSWLTPSEEQGGE